MRRKGCGSGCCVGGVGCVVLLALLAGLAWRLLTAGPERPHMSAAEQAAALKSAATTHQKVARLVKDGRAKRHRPFEVALTEKEINAFLAGDPRAQSALASRRVKDAFVRIQGGRVHATATRDMHGVPITVTATFVPTIQPDGTLGCDVRGLDLGALGVGKDAAGRVAGRIVQAINTYMLNSGLRYQSVRVETGRILLEGRT